MVGGWEVRKTEIKQKKQKTKRQKKKGKIKKIQQEPTTDKKKRMHDHEYCMYIP